MVEVTGELNKLYGPLICFVGCVKYLRDADAISTSFDEFRYVFCHSECD